MSFLFGKLWNIYTSVPKLFDSFDSIETNFVYFHPLIIFVLFLALQSWLEEVYLSNNDWGSAKSADKFSSIEFHDSLFSTCWNLPIFISHILFVLSDPSDHLFDSNYEYTEIMYLNIFLKTLEFSLNRTGIRWIQWIQGNW